MAQQRIHRHLQTSVSRTGDILVVVVQIQGEGEEYRMAYRLFRNIRETQRKNSRRQDSHRDYGQRPLSCGTGSEVKELKKVKNGIFIYPIYYILCYI